jgi:CheY-like chemotaxis protein
VFSLDEIVTRIAQLHRASAESKGLRLDWTISPEASGAYVGDAVRLTQVLSNLLSNAVKFTETGAVTLAVSQRGPSVVFAIEDTGIGFDEAVKSRLFRRFEQADASIRRRFGGTGLGLAISRSLVELMGGRIEAFSAPGEGARFEVTLPLERSETAPGAAAEDEVCEIDLEGRRILLAEDHPANQKVVSLILEAFGVRLDVVENGLQALEKLRTGAYDLVLMDMQMPEMDGLSATAALREMERARHLPRTPVVMLTANALDEHVRASLEAGADLHLSKPVRAEALVQAMVRAIQGGDDAPATTELRA